MVKVAIYARVSTKDQKIENQIDILRDYCRSRDFEIYKEYKDIGVSGSVFERRALKMLMRDATENKFEAVVVHKLDRFGRSAVDLLNGVEELKKLNVSFISISDNIDTSSHYGKLIFQILSAFAEFERSLLIERTNIGLRRARLKGSRSGKPCHRPRKEIDSEQLRELYTKRVPIAAIARLLNCSRTTIYSRLEEMNLR